MEELLPKLVQVVVILVPLACTALFAWLATQAGARMEAGAAKDATLEGLAHAEAIVRSLNQTLKPVLIERSADGKLSTEDAAHLKDVAVKELQQQWSDRSQEALEKGGAKLERLLSDFIESQVNKAKQLEPTKLEGQLLEVKP
jgi:hypothetical protein